MSTLQLMSEDMDDTQMPAIMSVVLPVFLNGIQDPVRTGMRGTTLHSALRIIVSCLSYLPMMESDSQNKLKTMIKPVLQPLLSAICSIISAPISVDNARYHSAFVAVLADISLRPPRKSVIY